MRLALLGTGWVLLALVPVVGPIPGPGGAILFGVGGALVLKNSVWAKRRYVRMERRWPTLASWTNWALRRTSPRHRREAAE